MNSSKYRHYVRQGVNRLEYRSLLVDTTINHPDYVQILLELINNTNEKASGHAARLLELSVKKQPSLILEHLAGFSELLSRIHLDAPVRSCAKIIEICCFECYVKNNQRVKDSLNSTYLERFTEVSFDWMIANKAIAIHAHSMYSLYLLGQQFQWIHPELTLLINKKLPTGSVGFQNRGKKILKAIKSNKLLKLY